MSDDEAIAEPGFGTMLGAGIFAFVTVTLIAIYLTEFNSTQAVLLGGISAVISGWAAVKSGQRAARKQRG
ncbi:hypothetical protein JCM18237_22160 [Halorubrum luteum]